MIELIIGLAIFFMAVWFYHITVGIPIICRYSGKHSYCEAYINKDGNWQTKCVNRDCTAGLELRENRWVEIEVNK